MYLPWLRKIKPSCIVVAIMLLACMFPCPTASPLPGAPRTQQGPHEVPSPGPSVPPGPPQASVSSDTVDPRTSETSEGSHQTLLSLTDVFFGDNSQLPSQPEETSSGGALDSQRSFQGPSSSSGQADAFFRVARRWPRRLRHRRGFIAGLSAKRSPRYANHDDPYFLTGNGGRTNLVVTRDGTVTTSNAIYPKGGKILRQVVGDNPPLDVMGKEKGSYTAKYYLKATEYNRFICINRSGNYFSSDKPEDECKFLIVALLKHEAYCSAIYFGPKRNPKPNGKRKWCIAINKHGKLRSPINSSEMEAHFLARDMRPKPIPTGVYNPFAATTVPPKEKELNCGKRKCKKRKNKKKKKKKKKEKKPKCEEDTLFSRKCAYSRKRKSRRWNHRGKRRRIPKRRPLKLDRPSSSFFST